MKRRGRAIALAGALALGGLALLDPLFREVTLRRAEVTALSERIPDAGPNLWVLEVRDSTGARHSLQPRSARPDLAPGDSLCIEIVTRPWAAPRKRIAAPPHCQDG